MRQVRYYAYGKPEVLHIEDVKIPEPAKNELLVKVSYVGLNPKDAALRNGFLKRLRNKKFPKLTGFDFSGVVEALGKSITDYQIGDPVYGYFENLNGGAAAEYITVKTNQIAHVSGDLRQASVMPCAYLTAFQAFRKTAIQPNQKLLIYGASGGVGTAAIQMGKILGAEITAVASHRNREYCLDQGADQFLAYDRDPISTIKEKFDVFMQVHVISGDLYKASKPLLMPRGKFITLSPNPLRSFGNIFKRQKIYPITVRANSKDLKQLNIWMSEGKLTPQISEEYPLIDIRAAHQSIHSQHTLGKIVVNVSG